MAKEKEELNFEENMEKLEEIVEKLESGDIPLDDAIKAYTEAMEISKKCNEKLENATSSINKILKDGKLEEFKEEL